MSPLEAFRSAWEGSLDWETYMTGFERIVAERSTSGPDRSEAMVAYTKLNLSRSRRWMKQLTVLPELENGLPLVAPQRWLVLTEYWCGDAAQCCPAMVELARRTPGLSLRFVFRDEHPALMDHHLTQGGRSIPKLIALDELSGNERFTWGPRPAAAQELVDTYRTVPIEERDVEAMKEALHTWYFKDGCEAVQRELLALCR
ncbi:MAG: thioredoxin family protein, partial [Flavobacteriales bacterium]|nr:thioredoxin family protein [Flavobacteriales bacterium]